jgi:hypothetical protein
MIRRICFSIGFPTVLGFIIILLCLLMHINQPVLVKPAAVTISVDITTDYREIFACMTSANDCISREVIEHVNLDAAD